MSPLTSSLVENAIKKKEKNVVDIVIDFSTQIYVKSDEFEKRSSVNMIRSSGISLTTDQQRFPC